MPNLINISNNFFGVNKTSNKQLEKVKSLFDEFKYEIDEDVKETNRKLANLVRQYTNILNYH